MALTQGAWSIKTLNGRLVLECDVTATTSETDLYTLKTPDQLDPTRPWTLSVNTAKATIDGGTLPVDIYAGYKSNFALGTGGALSVTSGSIVYLDAMDDVKSGAVNFIVQPEYTGAVVQGTVAGVVGRAALGSAPYYAFNLDGTAALSSAACHFVIIQ